ncbi:MAG TPA: universal stress protein [Candidatus Binataceae bacterium]|nr:universal stress protein [Candidatus Binataceae bacterium]
MASALFKKILCLVDFDRVSVPAIELVQKLALQNDATVYLLYVVPGPSLPADLEEVARDNMRGVAQKWLAKKVEHEIVVSSGKPAAGIVNAQQTLGVDLIVMATHGRTGADHSRLGSVAEQVIRLSSCPVVTVRPR